VATVTVYSYTLKHFQSIFLARKNRGSPVKIGITGSQGILGEALLQEFEDMELIPWTRQTLDITNPEQVNNALSQQLDVIIHCAALTNVNFCQENPEEAHKVNVVGTQHLIEGLTEKKKPLFVYISSTGNYGAWKTDPYTEEDHLVAPTVYHDSKLTGEKLVADQLENHLILRTGWLYGGRIEQKKNFVYQRYLDAKDKDEIYGDASQIGNPTFVGNVAKQLRVLLEKKIRGTINCVDTGRATRLEYVQEIIRQFDLNCQVIEAPEGHFARPAPVSPNESAINQKLNELGLNKMRNWKEALQDYILTVK
jgi:dTDP-4-dehydrorhamnose reductase